MKKTRSKQSICLKIVLVGDSKVGKTFLCNRYTERFFPDDCISTTQGDLTPECDIQDPTYYIGLWDTGGDEEYDNLRPFSYHHVDVFFVCFSVVDKESYKNVKAKWIPEIRRCCHNPTILLVGTKIDLRKEKYKSRRFKHAGIAHVNYEQGVALARNISAVRYMECSALNNTGTLSIFEEAVKTVKMRSERLNQKRKCALM